MEKTAFFLSVEEFKKLISEDAFVEYEEVYTDKFYGTLKSEVEKTGVRKSGHFRCRDVKGGVNLEEDFRRKCPFYFYCTTFYRRIGNED